MLLLVLLAAISFNYVIGINNGGIASTQQNVNFFEDPLDGGEACGAAGYVLDAPIPEVQEHYRKWRRRKRRRHRRAATNHAFRVWPNGEIPFVISPNFSGAGRRLIYKAMGHWSNQTCVKFVDRKKHDDYIYIYRGTGCCSYVGRRGGKQYLSLGSGCLRFGIITHELGHAVGFWHEQNRPDRSIYIDVIYDNVDSSKYLNFDPRESNEVNTFDQVYDYESIMHYGTRFFSKNKGKTIRTKTGYSERNKLIGESYYKHDGPVLSLQDVLETNILYQCTKLTECGGTIFANKGSFTSVNYPGTYPLATKRDCMWIITTKQNKIRDGKHPTITLIFENFNVGTRKRTGECDNDYVEVRDGKGFLSPYIVRYCGNISPSPITTLNGSLYVRFHMSGKNSNRTLFPSTDMLTGFKADFKTDVCSHRITKFPDTIKSPHFPFGYKKNQDCLWVIEANPGMQIEIEFLFFSLRELDKKLGCLDYLEIHEGDGNVERFMGRYCELNKPMNIVSNLKTIKIHFHASKRDRRGWYMGFQATVRQKDINECETGTHECSQACLNYPGGYFCGCYQGYSTVYQQDSRRAVCVDKDECAFENGGCSHECVNTDGNFVCSCPPGYTLSGNKTVCIDIDECLFEKKPCSHKCRNTIGGFECECFDGYLLRSDNTTCSVLPGCMTKFTTALGQIKPPVIPITYRRDVRCTWKIVVPKYLKVSLLITVPWSNDDGNCSNSLRIHGSHYEKKHGLNTRTFCGHVTNERITMEKNTAVIDYIIKAPYPSDVQIYYHSISAVKHHCGQVFNVTQGRFRTPGYPYKYPDSQNCVWTVHSPNSKHFKIRFITFALEYHVNCEYDYVDVEEHFYDIRVVKKIGRFCGDRLPPKIVIDGKKSFIRLKFHTDETMNEPGFKVIFKELK